MVRVGYRLVTLCDVHVEPKMTFSVVHDSGFTHHFIAFLHATSIPIEVLVVLAMPVKHCIVATYL